MNTFSNWNEVPIFDTEAAEALFWSENRPDLRLMESAVSGSSESLESVTISLRIDPRMLARIKRLARTRFLNYQSMIKQWLSERMEEEVAGETQQAPMKNQNRNRTSAFTLIELLVVIAIIGILAGLVTALGLRALQMSKIHRVTAELAQIKTGIEAYKAKKGYYPPDNPTDINRQANSYYEFTGTTNALYYELAGTTNDSASTPPDVTYTTLDSQDQVRASALAAVGIPGLVNSSTGSKSDDNFNAESFLSSIKSTQYTTNTGVKVFNVPVEGGDKSNYNPWHYVSSHPVNNPDSYDLWAEVLIGKKTNIIGNWSEHTIVK